MKSYVNKGPLIIQVLLGKDFNQFAVGPERPYEPELAWPSWRLNWYPRKIRNDPNRYVII